jgi:UDP-glucose 4-epimerase
LGQVLVSLSQAMRLLVTGAAGFIGSHLIPALLRCNYDVVGIDIAEHWPVHLRYDIRHESHLLSMNLVEGCRNVEGIIHLAALASPRIAQDQPDVAWSTNVQGTYNVLQLAKRLGIPRFIFLSSAHVYGISPKYFPTDERHPLALQDVYTSTKIAGEQLCRLFYDNCGLSYATLRLFNAYGVGQSKDYFLGVKLGEARQRRLTLRKDLQEVTKDWVHIRDVVEAVLQAVASPYVGPINIGTGVETSIGTITKAIAEMTGSEVVYEEGSDPGPTRMRADWRRARDVLGWRPTIDFAEGLADLVRKEMA